MILRDFVKYVNHAIIQVSHDFLKLYKDPGAELCKRLEKLSGYLCKDHDLYTFLLPTSPDSLNEVNNPLLSSVITNELRFSNWVHLPISLKLMSTTFTERNLIPSVKELKAFSNQLNYLNGKHIRVSCSMFTKWAYELRQNPKSGTWESTRGIFKFPFDHLKYKYNFTPEYFPSSGGGGTGHKSKNGSWDGVVGDVLSGRADLGLSLGDTFHRHEVIGYTIPLSYPTLVFATGVPQPQYCWKSVY